MFKRLIMMVLVMSVGSLAYVIWSALDRPVETVVVSGEPTAAERQRVQAALAFVQLEGILSTDLTLIEAQLIDMSWTRDVAVRRHWPDRLEVRLQKIVPVARWGERRYLAANGEPMELPDQYDDIPALSAHISTPQQTMELFRLLQLFASRQDLEISTLAESAQGEWLVAFANGLQLNLGAYDVSNRMNRFLRTYRAVQREASRAVEYADARYTSGIAVRFKSPNTTEETPVEAVAAATLVLRNQPTNNGL